MVTKVWRHLRRTWRFLILTDKQPVSSNDWDLYTYQLKYVNDNGVEITNLIEATHAHTDDDHVEFWDNDVLLLMVQRHSVRQVRNVTVMDFGM